MLWAAGVAAAIAYGPALAGHDQAPQDADAHGAAPSLQLGEDGSADPKPSPAEPIPCREHHQCPGKICDFAGSTAGTCLDSAEAVVRSPGGLALHHRGDPRHPGTSVAGLDKP
ncbi:MAG: hypothetical protein K0V04_36985 [Deltaproteobacteria bacterium]|nr:hypothetical protein [Deltaproteobacteria bacterium]